MLHSVYLCIIYVTLKTTKCYRISSRHQNIYCLVTKIFAIDCFETTQKANVMSKKFSDTDPVWDFYFLERTWNKIANKNTMILVRLCSWELYMSMKYTLFVAIFHFGCCNITSYVAQSVYQRVAYSTTTLFVHILSESVETL